MNHSARLGAALLGVMAFLMVDSVFAVEEPSDANTKAKRFVHAALKYELEGQTDFRNIVLREALKAESEYAPANWHGGRVQYQGRWTSAAEVRERAALDQTLKQYRELRERAVGDIKRQLYLARWCAREGMPERSSLHFAHLLLNPNTDPKTRAESLKKLKLQDYGGLLLTKEQVKQQQEVARQIETALKTWRPRFEGFRASIESDNEKRQRFAAAEIEKVDDPIVVPVAETFLHESGPRFGERLVELVGGFTEHEATQTLVRFSVVSPWPNVRLAATRKLKERPIHDFFPMLLDGLSAPIKSQWRVFEDPAGNVRYQHLVLREGKAENAAMAFEHVSIPNRVPWRIEGQRVTDTTVRVPSDRAQFRTDGRYDADFTSTQTQFTGIGLQRTQKEQLEALAALVTARQREQQLAMHNAIVTNANQFVFQVLEETSGAVVLRNPTAWWLWWEKYNETVKPKPTRFAYRPTTSHYERFTGYEQFERRTTLGRWVYPTPAPRRGGPRRPNLGFFRPGVPWHSCFAAGTKVWTETGLTAIENVRIGDRVYAQDSDTGELSLKLVVNTTVGAATSPLMKLNVEGEEIRPTLGHVAWVNGKGWRISKHVQEGDFLHGINGALEVWASEQLPAPDVVYNLVVEDFHTYFVGEGGVLVHDITYREPTRAIVPGLLPE